ncbi:MAG: ABC transporter permease [Eubacteriales bacterium]|nr:ABC transporter permease [Eubacteriales bacterium]
MKFLDLLRMSSSNLLRRKLRTVLTVLGVVIGTASIVVMISLGLGLQKSSLEQIEEYGGLTTITVNTWGGSSTYNSGFATSTSSSDETEEKRIDDALVETISQMPHVDFASPILSVSVLARQGMYEAWLRIQGMSQDALQQLDLDVAEGELPPADGQLKLFYGNQVLMDFYNAKTNEYFYGTGETPDVDLMDEPIFVIFDTDAYYQSQGSGDGSGQSVAPPKKYIIPTSGVMSGDSNQYSEYSYSVLADVDALKAELKKIFKGKPIPGQPTTKSGKPYKEIFYDEMMVRVDSMENVQEVQQAIQDMGYGTYSNADWMEQTHEQMRMIQLVLGGIGAVSLFVAAIGIANTMMMSIYERTKEIGIIKVLGCDLKNIRTMFLLEAGFIGFFGGLIGLILSGGISVAINMVASTAQDGYYAGISYIPLWLAAIALVFAVLVGMVAGFFPALRAMKLSPLAAIRNE